MLTIAVTGGVACGKSAFVRSFVEGSPSGRVACFSCDEAVRVVSSEDVIRRRLTELAAGFGLAASPDGSVPRELFRELLFENSEFRGKVEEVLHPLVLRRAGEFATGLSDFVRILLVEVPLLYEVDFPLDRDLDLAVVASEAVQVRRLRDNRGLEPDLVRRILGSQLPIEEKVKLAHVVVWNDGSHSALEAQTEHLISRCHPLLNS